MSSGRRKATLAVVSATLSLLVGAASGVGGYTFVYARGGSYLTNDPAACANCHVMREHLEAWGRSSHRAVATCNDCHTPHGFLAKYATKASNGFWHSFAFTSGRFPDPLRIKPHNRDVVEAQCRGCHAAVVAAIDPSGAGAGAHPGVRDGTDAPLACVRCHDDVGHLH